MVKDFTAFTVHADLLKLVEFLMFFSGRFLDFSLVSTQQPYVLLLNKLSRFQ